MGGVAAHAHDLADSGDLALARELARRADVFVKNFKRGALEEEELGYAEVSHTNPRVVYCSITGFGSGGDAELPGYDFLVQALGGLMSITGPTDGYPFKAGVALVDVLAAKDATIGILAALRARDVTGSGQRVEVNLLSSLLGSLANQAAGYLTAGVSPGCMGNAHPSIAPYQLLRCAGGSVAIACGNDAQFGRLCAVVGAEGLAVDSRFATNSVRVLNRDALIPELEGKLAGRPADD